MLWGDESPGYGELYVAPDVSRSLAGGTVHFTPSLQREILKTGFWGRKFTVGLSFCKNITKQEMRSHLLEKFILM